MARTIIELGLSFLKKALSLGLGKGIVLPSSFSGGPRYMMQNYQDAMALCRAYGNLYLFITFNSNKKWPTLNEMLAYVPGKKAYDRSQEFINSSIMPKGCNTSFVALIPKISNPMVVSDFRPISLIGAQYKIIAKLLANHLAKVVDSIISREQTVFVNHRQILDGPLMDCVVRDYWNNGWVFSWSRPILRGTLLQQLNVLSSTLDSVSLSDSEDIWNWSIGSPSFSVNLDHILNPEIFKSLSLSPMPSCDLVSLPTCSFS
nr:RNA-directed DNA polymerase, eukaryota, reverse transcriptase zinc-binding domain protein [Tanacetum cinerariifolium]GEX60524.1 RNA-directed DNA polymerase, eukaryota, reverse transcriptase zinc-binding domain protein [Tanacetum cinerariifolium]